MDLRRPLGLGGNDWWPTSWNVGMGLGGNSSQFILTIECWGRLTLVLDLTAPADVARANEEQP
jgi:hypothetical protein